MCTIVTVSQSITQGLMNYIMLKESIQTPMQHHLSTSPVLHFDSQHIDGLNKTDLNDGDHIPVWRDRTHARHTYYYQSSVPQYSKWDASRHGADLGGVNAYGSHFKNNSNPNGFSGGTVGSAHENTFMETELYFGS